MSEKIHKLFAEIDKSHTRSGTIEYVGSESELVIAELRKRELHWNNLETMVGGNKAAYRLYWYRTAKRETQQDLLTTSPNFLPPR